MTRRTVWLLVVIVALWAWPVRAQVVPGSPFGTSGGGGGSSVENMTASRLTADVTNATGTLANLTALSQTLSAGTAYTFHIAFRTSNSLAADGLKFDFAGGTATATTFWARCDIKDTALLFTGTSTAIGTDILAATATGESALICEGYFLVNAGGTFIPRAAGNTAASGTQTTFAGSFMWVELTS